jgi:hypothetical protein
MDRGQLLLAFARGRLVEATGSRDDPNGVAAILREMDGDTHQGVSILASDAVERRDEAGLDLIDSFVKGQLAGLRQFQHRSGGPLTSTVMPSIELLNRVQARTAALRAVLYCGWFGGTDDLGPVPPPRCGPTSGNPESPINEPPVPSAPDDGLIGGLGRILGDLLEN